jgi:glycerol dehydrogenase-like iron-containing ADH family enzyme
VRLVDRRPQPGTVWNRLRPQEEETILREALRQPELSSRELACWVTDQGGFSVSESSIYRLLKRHGLIHEVEVVGSQRERNTEKRRRASTNSGSRMRATSSWWVGVGIT